MREVKFRALYEGIWYYQSLEEIITITLAAFRNGKHKTQFTGMKDANGKEIYEGDIVKRITEKWGKNAEAYTEEEVSFIEYRNQGFWVKDEGFGWEGEGLWIWEDMEVIGNIYENPELIKDESETK